MMSTIERQPVSSSNIKSIGHDSNQNVLAVEFKDGSVYHYHDVPADAHDALVGAKSVGGHFHANIKNNYTHSRQ